MNQRMLQVMQVIRRKIDERSLAPGEKLPSVRECAVMVGVSPSTVVEAYDRLVAEGLIYARPRSGFYVSHGNKPLMLVQTGQRPDRETDPVWMARDFLRYRPGTAAPGCGWLHDDCAPVELLRKATRSVQRGDSRLFSSYSNPRGSERLRHIISGRLAAQGTEAGLNNILLTQSASCAVDLICRLLLSPGDKVLVDDPCHYNLRALFQAHKVQVIGVPYTADGPDTGWFEDVLQRNKIRLYITNSALQNPTGATITHYAAHKILTMAARNDMVIIEDDSLAEFEPDLSPRFAALDGLDRVIRVGGFSRSLSASVRCGYIAARRDWADALTDLQVATNFGGPSPLVSEILCYVLGDSGYCRHMDALRRRLARSRLEVAERLAAIGVTQWLIPRGGFSLWCQLPDSIDAVAVARHARSENVILAPGNLFSPSQSMASFMLFNVSQMDDPRVYSVLDWALQEQSALVRTEIGRQDQPVRKIAIG